MATLTGKMSHLYGKKIIQINIGISNYIVRAFKKKKKGLLTLLNTTLGLFEATVTDTQIPASYVAPTDSVCC